MRRQIITASVVAILSTVALAAPAAASSAVVPGAVVPSETRTALTSPPPPPPAAGGGISAQACVLGVWDGQNYTGRSACFSATQVADWDGYTYADGTRINDTASSTWNYGNFRLRLCIHRDYVDCTPNLLHPNSGWTRLNSWDNAVSSHFNAST